MELVVRKSDLLRELQLFQGIVERKNTIPILANVLVEADGDEMRMLATDLEVGRRAYSNPPVRHVLIRKNQGQQSGASQPHVHSQVIGSDMPLPSVAREVDVSAGERVWLGYLGMKLGLFAYLPLSCPTRIYAKRMPSICELSNLGWAGFLSFLRGETRIVSFQVAGRSIIPPVDKGGLVTTPIILTGQPDTT